MMKPLTEEIDLEEFLTKVAEPLGEMVAALHRKALVKAVVDIMSNGD